MALPAGLVVDATEVGLADAIAAVIEDEALRSSAAVRGPEIVLESYGAKGALDAILPLYQRLAKK